MKIESLPSFSSYGNYSSSNYGLNCIKITIPHQATGRHGIELYYSYDTIVAFYGFVKDFPTLYISENIWTTTTGKHLNFINTNKKARIPHNEFEKLLAIALRNA